MKIVVEPLDFLELAEHNRRVFWKEVIYANEEGESFQKGRHQKFSVDTQLLDHWVSTFNLMLELEIEVPVPEEHTSAPSMKKGVVLALQRRKDSKEREGLFAKIEFIDDEAAKLARTAKVSVFVPPEFTDEHGHTFSRPIRHVALTDYPVLNGLDGFLAASHQEEGEEEMPLRKLAVRLGMTLADDDDDEKVADDIVKKFGSMEKKLSDGEGAEKTRIALEEEEKKKKALEAANDDDDDDEKKKKPEEVAASMVLMLGENRANKIDKLITDGKITPAVAKDLKSSYADDGALRLSLCDIDDGFNKVMSALDKNDPVKLAEQTGPQTNRGVLELADGEKNPLLKDAEQRATAATV